MPDERSESFTTSEDKVSFTVHLSLAERDTIVFALGRISADHTHGYGWPDGLLDIHGTKALIERIEGGE